MSGGVTLTEASSDVIPRILAEVRQRRSPEVAIIGRADTAGSSQSNIALATRRAHAVRAPALKAGVAQALIEVTAFGEFDLLVATGDGVDEPLNRRVEVQIR